MCILDIFIMAKQETNPRPDTEIQKLIKEQQALGVPYHKIYEYLAAQGMSRDLVSYLGLEEAIRSEPKV